MAMVFRAVLMRGRLGCTIAQTQSKIVEHIGGSVGIVSVIHRSKRALTRPRNGWHLEGGNASERA